MAKLKRSRPRTSETVGHCSLPIGSIHRTSEVEIVSVTAVLATRLASAHATRTRILHTVSSWFARRVRVHDRNCFASTTGDDSRCGPSRSQLRMAVHHAAFCPAATITAEISSSSSESSQGRNASPSFVDRWTTRKLLPTTRGSARAGVRRRAVAHTAPPSAPRCAPTAWAPR